VPLYLQAAGWQAGFGLGGWWPAMLPTAPWLCGWPGAIWVHGVAAIPWVVLIVGVGLRFVEPELEEQAVLDGTPGQVFFCVTLRRAATAVVIAGLWVAVTSAAEMTVTDLMRIRTYAEEIYTDFAAVGTLDEGPAPFWLGVALTGLLMLAGMGACSGFAANLREPHGQNPWRLRLGRWRWPAACVVGLGSLVLVGVPLANLALKAGTVVVRIGDQRIPHWSLTKCAAMVVGSPLQHGRELGWSLVIAVCAAGAVVLVAVLLAWPARRSGAGRGALLITTAITLAIPGPIVGVAIIYLLNQRAIAPLVWLYDRSILAPWIAQAIRALPLPLLMLWYALSTVPDAVLDSATTDGAGWFTRLVRVALPTRIPALAGAGLVAGIVAFGELSATVLVVPPGITTLPVRMFGLLHYGIEDQVAGICLAVLVMIVALTSLGWYVVLADRRLTAR
ncbi:MAG: hypothetical protein A2W31_15735, partial [Planctomycetes bacterium RBG_16_64_10]